MKMSYVNCAAMTVLAASLSGCGTHNRYQEAVVVQGSGPDGCFTQEDIKRLFTDG